jgi:hypothetical protein
MEGISANSAAGCEIKASSGSGNHVITRHRCLWSSCALTSKSEYRTTSEGIALYNT